MSEPNLHVKFPPGTQVWIANEEAWAAAQAKL